MKNILLSFIFAVPLLCLGQNYKFKSTTYKQGEYFSPIQYSIEHGYIYLDSTSLTIFPKGFGKRTYKIMGDIEYTKEGIQFVCMFKRRAFTVIYNDEKLLIKRYKYYTFYHFQN